MIQSPTLCSLFLFVHLLVHKSHRSLRQVVERINRKQTPHCRTVYQGLVNNKLAFYKSHAFTCSFPLPERAVGYPTQQTQCFLFFFFFFTENKPKASLLRRYLYCLLRHPRSGRLWDGFRVCNHGYAFNGCDSRRGLISGPSLPPCCSLYADKGRQRCFFCECERSSARTVHAVCDEFPHFWPYFEFSSSAVRDRCHHTDAGCMV